MSSPGYAPPLVLEIGPSRRLALALAGLYGLAIAALTALTLLPLVRVAIAVGLILSLRREWRLHAGRSHPQAITALAWTVDGLRVRTRTGRWWTAVQEPGGLVTPALVVLPLRLPEARRGYRHRGLVLAADATPAPAHRRLRLRLLNP
ncbi:hypothetical protein SAMN05660831_00374 [Thiohalospira halophila DSM 15071]|uniref:Toxin CptA n=1 Tax=Thiohalospira halophila DSM 15071 TaxID=1123397 RepID=A0A1I1NPU0_9GAMM|nr:protein YgfX [Thiohalospira halophila]SFC99547.1 hypothetical protein SAMN05660831_00374 [Thiohalospira halophila DSM 15071]